MHIHAKYQLCVTKHVLRRAAHRRRRQQQQQLRRFMIPVGSLWFPPMSQKGKSSNLTLARQFLSFVVEYSHRDMPIY